jgi:hypothetical protein
MVKEGLSRWPAQSKICNSQFCSSRHQPRPSRGRKSGIDVSSISDVHVIQAKGLPHIVAVIDRVLTSEEEAVALANAQALGMA